MSLIRKKLYPQDHTIRPVCQPDSAQHLLHYLSAGIDRQDLRGCRLFVPSAGR